MMFDAIEIISGSDEFLEMLLGQAPLFTCVLASTETSKIEGISGAGAVPALTDLTPGLDAELVTYGEPKTIQGVPVTPGGTLTPAVMSRAAITLSDIPFLAIDAGTAVKPKIPFITVNTKPAMSVVTGHTVEGAKEIYEKGQRLGTFLSKASSADYLVIGESTPGGTTTALGVMLAMGYDAKGKVSGAMPHNPHDIKNKAVEDGFKKIDAKPGDFFDDPFGAVEALGDPMMVTVAGIASSYKGAVVLAGGTQMASPLAILKSKSPESLERICVATTEFVSNDTVSDFKGLLKQVADVPLFSYHYGFENSDVQGLKGYISGDVKEGVGMGGCGMAYSLKTKSGNEKIRKECEQIYDYLATKFS
jgi:uncharacterized protein (TIGR00303 family)